MNKENIKKTLPPDNHKIRELEQEIEMKNEIVTALEEQNKEETSQNLTGHGRRELEQEIEFKNEIVTALEEQNKKETSQNLTDHRHREHEQEKQMFEELLESLEGKASSDMEQFFSMISHELKTPLVPIAGYVKMLKEEQFGNLDAIQKEKLGIVDSNTTALSKLIQSMLDYQKLSSGSMEMKKEENNIEKIVSDAFASLESEFKQKEVEKMVSVEGNIELICDAQRISQVLTALLENSLNAIQPKLGRINVSVSQLENTVTVLVHDNGCGIPKEQLDKVFSKFYQLDMSNTREKGGVGLGLSICQKIIDAHDGKIWIESELDKGTTINLTLPRK
jgi:signal transduction histidine kinase